MKNLTSNIRSFSHVGFIPSWPVSACGRQHQGDTILGRYNDIIV